MKLGIFGGTFDPLHVGHLIVADDAAFALALDRVLFVPAGAHPLKGGSVEASASLRARMIREAIAGLERFVLDERELKRDGSSYTIDTVNELAQENPGAELYVLVGSDILKELHRWHRAKELAERARIIVMSRADVSAPDEPEVDIEYTRVEVAHIGISSTEIRERVRRGRPYRYLVPDNVYRTIENSALYVE